ncbi:MAG: hypothetical protein M9958_03465 [Chitinophagales bacterium]|nr:hypothetical protein [Chitinophagales bacterium]
MSKRISKTSIFLSIAFLILGIRSNWREYTFRKASVFAEATVISVDTKLKSGKAIASVDYVLTYKRDNVTDTISHFTTEAYSIEEPLPSIEELKKNKFYIHYVPKNKRNETPFNDRIYITNTNVLESTFRSGWFNLMFFVLVVSYLLSRGVPQKIEQY